MNLIDKTIKEQPCGLEKTHLPIQDTPIKTERIFISGQISNLPFDDAMDKFRLASIKLIDQGYETVNPLHIEGWEDNLTWKQYMCLCFKELLTCDAIYLLHDWGSSKGARIEYAIAKEMGLKIIYES